MIESQHQGPLSAAILRAQGRIKALNRGSTNKHQGYNYTSAEDIYQAARDALIAEEVLVMLGSWSIESDEPPRPPEVVGHVIVSGHGHSFTNRFAFPAIESKGKPFDKAVAGALTMGFREWLRLFLLIPRVDMEEVDARDDREHIPAKAPSRPVSEDIPF